MLILLKNHQVSSWYMFTGQRLRSHAYHSNYTRKLQSLIVSVGVSDYYCYRSRQASSFRLYISLAETEKMRHLMHGTCVYRRIYRRRFL